MNFKKQKKWSGLLLFIVLLFSLFTGGCDNIQTSNFSQDSDRSATVNINSSAEIAATASVDKIPTYDGYEFVEINNNQPYFSDDDKQRTDAFEEYSELDDLGRCGVAYANICQALQPTDPRGEIGMIKPSGWHTVKYNDIIDGNYLYNRCHLIGFQLAGENANPKNLITGTRYLNIVGMLPFENAVDDYVDTKIMYFIALLLYLKVMSLLPEVCLWKHILSRTRVPVFNFVIIYIIYSPALALIMLLANPGKMLLSRSKKVHTELTMIFRQKTKQKNLKINPLSKFGYLQQVLNITALTIVAE